MFFFFWIFVDLIDLERDRFGGARLCLSRNSAIERFLIFVFVVVVTVDGLVCCALVFCLIEFISGDCADCIIVIGFVIVVVVVSVFVLIGAWIVWILLLFGFVGRPTVILLYVFCVNGAVICVGKNFRLASLYEIRSVVFIVLMAFSITYLGQLRSKLKCLLFSVQLVHFGFVLQFSLKCSSRHNKHFSDRSFVQFSLMCSSSEHLPHFVLPKHRFLECPNIWQFVHLKGLGIKTLTFTRRNPTFISSGSLIVLNVSTNSGVLTSRPVIAFLFFILLT